MSATVNEEMILDALHQIPQNRWGEVLSYITSLRSANEPARETGKHPLTASELLASGLVGIWSDRTDIPDNRELARRLREQAQARSRG